MQGTIYKNKNRYWWKVRLPDAEKTVYIPLKPAGAKFATSDYAVAVEVAKSLWKQACAGKTVSAAKTIENLIGLYKAHCEVYYQQNPREAKNIGYALDFLAEKCGKQIAQDFGPLALQSHRDRIIEKGLARSTVNKHIKMIQRMFKWGASQQVIPITTYQAVATVEGLRAGRSNARETEHVKPVPVKDYNSLLPHLPPVLKAMVQLQKLTGMRSEELCAIGPEDIDTSKNVWIYKPAKHKTAYRGHTRIIAIGPQGQAILKPYMKNRDYCFLNPKNTPYNTGTYRTALQRIMKKHKINLWFPHQLRHSAGTEVRKKLSREAARAFLGHRNSRITDDYAEIDMTLAAKAAESIG
jgi:integrase